MGAVCCADLAMSLPAVQYEPSALEREWSTGGLHHRICETAKLPHQISGARTWVEYIAQASRGGPWTPRRPPSAAERRVLSRIVDRDGCEGFIEPLTGIARHPFASIGCKMKRELQIFKMG